MLSPVSSTGRLIIEGFSIISAMAFSCVRSCRSPSGPHGHWILITRSEDRRERVGSRRVAKQVLEQERALRPDEELEGLKSRLRERARACARVSHSHSRRAASTGVDP